MGLSQWIIRNDGTTEPSINDKGEWVNATECIELRKEYWLRNAINPLTRERYGKNVTDMCSEFIPLSKEDLKGILEKTKNSVKLKDEIEVMRTFDMPMFYSNHDFDWCLMGMAHFNRVMSNRLRSNKETQYYYIESW